MPAEAKTLFYDSVRIAHGINALALLVSAVMFFVHLLAAGQPHLALLDGVAALFSLLAWGIYFKGRNRRLFLRLVAAMVFFAVYLIYIFTLKGQPTQQFLGPWLIFFPFVSLILLGLREGGIFAALFVAAVLGYTASGVGRFTDWAGFLSLSLALIVFALLAFWVESSRRRALGAMERSIARQQTLLREVHHRVKNNLNLISAILGLQAQQDAKARAGLTDARSRIEAIAAVHHMLYGRDDIERVDLAPYLKELADRVLEGCAKPGCPVKLVVQSEGIALELSEAIALGLMTHELLANSCKHAFKTCGGAIEISLKRSGENLVYSYKDNGQGAPLPPEKTGLGLRLVQMAADQLEGRLEPFNDGGLGWRLTFKAGGGA